MSEREYILVANLTRLRVALSLINAQMTEYGITLDEKHEIQRLLDPILSRMEKESVIKDET